MKRIFVNFSSLEVPTDLLSEFLHEESTHIPNYTLQTKQTGVHTALESHNCAATYDQSSITTNICYVSKNMPANTITLAHPVKSGISANSAKDRLNITSTEGLAGHAIAALPTPIFNT